MIVALLNQKGGVGKTTLALHLAGASAAKGLRVTLTVDVTPELRGRIKIAAFQRGETVADMLRDLLAREFPHVDGGAP